MKLARLLVASLVVMTLVGCGAATPQQLMTHMAQTTAANDKAGYVACYAYTDPAVGENVAAFFTTIQVSHQFKAKYSRVYGEGAASEYCGESLRDLVVNTPAEACRYVIEGDRALVEHPLYQLELVRLDGVWKVDYRGYDTPEELELIRAQTLMFNLTSNVYKQLMTAMDQPGMTPDKLAEMETVLMEDMYNLSRHRAALTTSP